GLHESRKGRNPATPLADALRESVAPAREHRVAPGVVALHGEAALHLPGAGDLVGGRPDARAETGEQGGAQGGGVEHLRTDDLEAEEIGLELHEQVVGGGTAVHAKGAQRLAEVL